jgi:hypothetical protein
MADSLKLNENPGRNTMEIGAKLADVAKNVNNRRQTPGNSRPASPL